MRAMVLGAGILALAVSPSEAAARPLDRQLRTYLKHMAQSEQLDDAEHEKEVPTRVSVADFVGTRGHRFIAVFAQGYQWCGATGNCEFMVLERRGRSFRDVSAIAVADAPVRLLVTRHHGMPDLSCWVHDGADNYHEQRVWFDGRKYRDGDTIGGYVHGRKIRSRVAGFVLIPRKQGQLL